MASHFSDMNDLRANLAVDHTWNPLMDAGQSEETYRLWKKAVTKSFDSVD